MTTAIAFLDSGEAILLLQISFFLLFWTFFIMACVKRIRKKNCLTAAVAAVNAQDEEPERMEEGPRVTREAQRTVDRERVDDRPTGAS